MQRRYHPQCELAVLHTRTTGITSLGNNPSLEQTLAWTGERLVAGPTSWRTHGGGIVRTARASGFQRYRQSIAAKAGSPPSICNANTPRFSSEPAPESTKRKSKRGDGWVYRRGAIWWVQYHRNGTPYRESSGSTKEADARKLLKRRLGEIALGRFVGPDAERVTIRQLAEDYLTDYRVNQRKSLDKAERTVRRLDDDGNETDAPLMACFGAQRQEQSTRLCR